MLEIKGYYTNGDYMGWNGKCWQRYPTEEEYREEVNDAEEIENTFQRLIEVKMRKEGDRKEDSLCRVSL